MRRIFLYFHIRRSERKQILLVFGLPVLIWTMFQVLPTRLDRPDTAPLEAKLDSLVTYQQAERTKELQLLASGSAFKADTCSERFWVSTGLDGRDASRLINYQKAGGRIRKGKDLDRLAIGDSVWRFYMKPRIMELPPEQRRDYISGDWTKEMTQPLYSVDINRVDSAKLLKLGLPTGVRRRWLKFLDRGGRFKEKKDLLRIYGLDSAWLASWSDSLIVEVDQVEEWNSISLNSIDSVELFEYLLLSPWESRRYIDYRDALGGYVLKSQLWELNLDSGVTQRLSELELTEIEVKRKNLNEISREEMIEHPYISWKMANSIIFYRSKVRPIESVDQLRGLEEISEHDLERLKWYFK